MKIYKVIVIVLIGLGTALSTGCDKDTVSMADPEIDSTVAQKSLNSDDKLTPEMIDILKEYGIDPDSLVYNELSEVEDYEVDKEAWEKLLKEQEGRSQDSILFRYPLEEEHLFRSSATPALTDFTVIDLYNPPANGSISVHYEGVQVTTQYSSGDTPLGVAMAIRNNINNNPNIQLTAGGPIGPTVVLTEKRAGCEYNGKVVYITSSQGSHICVNHSSTYMSGGTDDGIGCTSGVPAVPQLKLPNNGANNQLVDDLWLEWFPSDGATSYHIQVATNSNFTNPGLNISGYNNNGLWLDDLNYNTIYYWRVRAYNAQGFSAWSSTRNFKTFTYVRLASSYIDPFYGYVLMQSATGSNIPSDFIKVDGVSIKNGDILARRINEKYNDTFVDVSIMVAKYSGEPTHNWLQIADHEWIKNGRKFVGTSDYYLKY